MTADIMSQTDGRMAIYPKEAGQFLPDAGVIFNDQYHEISYTV